MIWAEAIHLYPGVLADVGGLPQYGYFAGCFALTAGRALSDLSQSDLAADAAGDV
jgi:hypothetical protein